MAKRKIVLFGGTFDPIHLGHTVVAADAAEKIGAEKIVFIPARRSPLKKTFPKTSDDHRAKMITLAIADNRRFQLSDYELKKEPPSFTLDTVKHFQTGYGGDTLIYWLMGADTVAELPRWYKVDELIDCCTLAVMYRAGCAPPDFTEFEPLWGPQRTEKLRQNVIQTPLIDISSTQIRNRLAHGQDVSDMLHASVAGYIPKNNLYR